MAYALLLPTREPPDADAVAAAFEASPDLVPADARRRGGAGQGVLAIGLQRPSARSVQRHLLELGVVAEVVTEAWLQLPEEMTCRRAAPSAEALRIYDAHGQARSVPWAQVKLIAAGHVPVGEQVMVQRDASSVLMGEYGEYDVAPEYEYRETDCLLLDIVCDEPVRRYRITSDRFDYGYLGERKTSSSGPNFAKLVRDLAANATGVPLNAGAEALVAQTRSVVRYRRSQLFERESGWLLWRHHGPGAQYDGDLDYRREPFVAEPPVDTFTDRARKHQADRVIAETAQDFDRHMKQGRPWDRVMAGAAGLVPALLVAQEFGFDCDGFDLGTCDYGAAGPIGLFLIALVAWAAGAALAFVLLRQWRRSEWWW